MARGEGGGPSLLDSLDPLPLSQDRRGEEETHCSAKNDEHEKIPKDLSGDEEDRTVRGDERDKPVSKPREGVRALRYRGQHAPRVSCRGDRKPEADNQTDHPQFRGDLPKSSLAG